MLPVPPIPGELWSQIPPAAQAAIPALIQQYEQRLQALQQQVAELTEPLNQNPTNPPWPPSSDPPHVKLIARERLPAWRGVITGSRRYPVNCREHDSRPDALV